MPPSAGSDVPAKPGEASEVMPGALETYPGQEGLSPDAGLEGRIRIQQLYWKELVQLKVECEYVRRYQAVYRWWVTRIEMVKAVLSVGALGGWAVTHVPAGIWGVILVAVQIANAAQQSLPLARHYQSLSALVIALDTLFITVLGEWEEIQAARVDEAALAVARQNLMKQMHEAHVKHFPTGLDRRDKLFKLAEVDAAAYIRATFGTEPD